MIDELISACFSEFCEIAGDSPCGCDACPYGRTNDDCYAIYEHDKLITLEKKGITPLTWIPVSERLPNTIPCDAGTAYSETVNILTSERKVLTAIFDGTDFIADAEFWEAENEIITHWTPVPLPLPEPPKEV